VAAPVLSTRAITKRFPGVTALSEFSFDLMPGEIHALCGENGAGKSTLIKLLTGLHPHGSYEGELEVGGRPARFKSIADAEEAGLAVIYQELALVSEMSAAENLFLGCEPTRHGLIDWGRMLSQSRVLLERYGLKIDPAAPVSGLGVGQRQFLEIIKALRKNPRILVLDEPTAALSRAEVEILLCAIEDLRRGGLSCVYISHKLDEVFRVADHITVLRDGRSVASLRAAEVGPQDVIRHMVGREILDLYPRAASDPKEVLLAVSDLRAQDERGAEVLKGISFQARAGEVLGIGGLMGAGRSELLMHLFGAWGTRRAGRVELAGEPLAPGDPGAAIRRGLVLVTEDRRRYGLIFEHSVGFNLSLSSLRSLTRRGLIDRAGESARGGEISVALRIKAPNLETDVAGLSGGNQQKVVIGKALMTGPRVVLLDEPTRGIDVGAKQEVYAIINELTAAGKAVIMVSSELPELMGMCDRIVMLREGRVAGEFPQGADAERLISAALGHGMEARS